MSVFKSYDIRGRYPDEVNEELFYRVGRAFVALTKTSDVLVGRDARTHSLPLQQALIRGITAQGANVTDIGLATTPQVIAMHEWADHDTAIIVTASHLDAPFNGCKMYMQHGQPINKRRGMQELEALTRGTFTDADEEGRVIEKNYTETYATRIAELAPLQGTWPRFVADCSNGSAGPEVTFLRDHLQLPLAIINAEPDGMFPNHSPNPVLPVAHTQVQRAIRSKQAAGGCIFDADADRVVFFDENGAYIHPNAVSCMIIAELLRERKGRAVAYDLISSNIVAETIAANGGKPLRTVVGRNMLVDDMREHNAIFGGEVSSHMVYADVAYADASTLSMLLVLRSIARAGKPLSALVAQYNKYAALERNYRVPDAAAALKAVEHTFPGAEKDYLDGVTLRLPEGWLVARTSNTEPVVRLRGEAADRATIERLFHKAEKAVLQQGGHVEY